LDRGEINYFLLLLLAFNFKQYEQTGTRKSSALDMLGDKANQNISEHLQNVIRSFTTQSIEHY